MPTALDSRLARGQMLPVSLRPEYIGLSTDTKPTLTQAEAGQHFLETNTGGWFIWDGAAWHTFTTPAVPVTVNLALLGFADGADVTQGARADAAVTDPTASGTLVGLLKGLLKVLGLTTGAAVITDATGSIQQYLRGLIKLHLAGIAVTALPALPTGANTIGKVQVVAGSATIGAVESPVVIVAGASRTSITCTLSDTDYAAGAAVPAGVVRVLLQAVGQDAVIANEVTTGTVGITLRADQQYAFRVTPGDTLHAQSANAGTVVQISYLKS